MMAIYELIFYCHLVLLVVICFVVIGYPSQVYAHSHLYSNNTTMLLHHIHFVLFLFKYLIVILFVLHFENHIFCFTIYSSRAYPLLYFASCSFGSLNLYNKILFKVLFFTLCKCHKTSTMISNHFTYTLRL